jgi:shikimate kinase
MLDGTNLYLIGMMGVGKSTIGRLLAKKMGYMFMDTDALVEQCTGQSVTSIFAELGEAGFRSLEHQVLAEVSAYTRLVVATGGGIVLDPMNWSHLRDGIILWLDLPVESLYQRLSADQSRPLLQTSDPFQTLTNIYEQRRDRYAQADLQIKINPAESPQMVCDRLIDLIESKIERDRLR